MDSLFRFSNITLSFNEGKQILSASGAVEEGQILAITGPSGAGKSTLLRILCRLIAPETGEILLQGEDAKFFSPQEWRRRVHYLPQKAALFEGSVERNLQKPFDIVSVSRVMSYDGETALHLLTALGLATEMLQQNAGTLSGGEAARVALIRAILLKPQVLLLDEPTAALDDRSRIQVMCMLRQWLEEAPSRAIILVSHNQDDLNELPKLRELKLGTEQGEISNEL